MGKHYEQLSLRERMEIDLWRREGFSRREIALRLDRSPATISRELRRNTRPTKQWSGPYDGERAHSLAARRRRWDARYKLARQPDLADHVKQHLAMGLSPEQIAGRLTHEHARMSVSHESIYRFIYHRVRQHDHSWRRLLPRAKSRRGRFPRRGGSLLHLIKHRVPISRRPQTVADRTEPGHWEGDLMTFRRNRQVVLVLHERLSRFISAFRLPDKTAAATIDRIIAAFRYLPKSLARSITFDNGGEFAKHHQLNDKFHISTYFCDAHAPWQKGGVENAIGGLRRFLPRGTDLDLLPTRKLDKIVSAYNAAPRKILSFKSANEVFCELNRVALQP
jgi:IS30 family transposase